MLPLPIQFLGLDQYQSSLVVFTLAGVLLQLAWHIKYNGE